MTFCDLDYLGEADLVSAVLAGCLSVLPVHIAVAVHRNAGFLVDNQQVLNDVFD
jgi:hypothetical protein